MTLTDAISNHLEKIRPPEPWTFDYSGKNISGKCEWIDRRSLNVILEKYEDGASNIINYEDALDYITTLMKEFADDVKIPVSKSDFIDGVSKEIKHDYVTRCCQHGGQFRVTMIIDGEEHKVSSWVCYMNGNCNIDIIFKYWCTNVQEASKIIAGFIDV